MSDELVENVTAACCRIFEGKMSFELPEEYYYTHLPLCVIDAVFSIGVRYESVINTINRFCSYYNIDKHSKSIEYSTTHFLELIQKVTLDDLTKRVFCNRQRTSATNGILKSEAVILFLKLLQRYNIETRKDVDLLLINDQFETDVKKIPGQRSGISYKYFLMLSGSDDLVKPDRMILRFLEGITNTRISLENCQIIIQEVVRKMNAVGFNLTPKKLDNLIWNYQRSK
jgi:hypothetical protein